MTFENALETFTAQVRHIENLNSAVALLGWDMHTVMPAKGAAGRAEVMAAVQGEAFRAATGADYGAAMETLRENADKLPARAARMLEEAWLQYSRFKTIPAATYQAYCEDAALSSQVWTEAKQKSDYALYRPHLQKMIDYKREFCELWGYTGTPYDALLAEYDPALPAARLDPVFETLLAGTRTLLAKRGEVPPLHPVQVAYPQQKALVDYLIGVIGFDMAAGNEFPTEHPFTSGIHRGDVRITTHYDPASPITAIFGVLHEGGHGLYDQNVGPDLAGTNLAGGASMAIHESQSRFYENTVGRSLPFWQAHFEKACGLLGARMADSPEHFFKSINAVEPGTRRLDADELTYNLHIIIRYECEKAIINDKVNADALPELWREKYRAYLGVTPETDAEGLMQDIHWSDGSFGYFPSYTIGNLCGAQFTAAFEKQHGPLANHLGIPEGMARIGSWLRENIHVHSALEKPAQLMQRVCGEDVNPQYFLDYMAAKLAAVYD